MRNIFKKSFLYTEILKIEFEQRKKTLHKFKEKPTLSFSKIAKTFKIAKATVRDVFIRYISSLTIERKSLLGKKRSEAMKNIKKKVINSCKQNPGLSDEDRAKKYGTTRKTVSKWRSEEGLHSYLAIDAPNCNNEQEKVSKFDPENSTRPF